MSEESLVNDPRFQALPAGAQQTALAGINPQYGVLDHDHFSQVVTGLQKRALARPDLAPPSQASHPSDLSVGSLSERNIPASKGVGFGSSNRPFKLPAADTAPEEPGLFTGPQVPLTEGSAGLTGPAVQQTFARELSAGKDAITGIPSSLYHAFADNPTQEETQKAGEEISGPKRIGLGIDRSVVQPVVNAADFYKQAFQGKVPDATGQALSVAPEAIGNAAATVGLAEAAPEAIKTASQARKTYLPTTSEVGKMFEPISKAAENTPVDINKPRAIAEEARLEEKAGANLPKVLRNYLDRTEPTPAAYPYPADPAEPMNYPESRRFASNASRLSVQERLEANPNMQRLVGQFAKALKETNRDAAEKVGMGAEYDAAMKKYATVAKRQDMLDNLKEVAKEHALHAVIGGGILYGGYKALSAK